MSRPFIVTSSIPEVRRAVAAARAEGLRVGCVPTMGALHSGHMSLVKESRQRAEFTVVTIFVNPAQFAPHEDLSKYPRPIELDLQMCREAHVDLVFTPDQPTLYPPGFQTWVTVDEISKSLEGEFRPSHFRGVTTVVLKLFQIVQCDIACFGAKDYQQHTVIRRMVHDLDMPVDVIVCPTIREPDGLALSSRNIYLSPGDRQTALCLSSTLQHAQQRVTAGERDLTLVQTEMCDRLRANPGVAVDYAVIAEADSLEILSEPRKNMVALIAAKVGQTRLIDNLRLALPPR